MTPFWRLRPGSLDDVGALYALDQRCFDPPFQFDLSSMIRFVIERDAVVVVADAGRVLAGFVILHSEHGSGYVVTLDVAPEFRRKGVAQALLRAAEQGLDEVELHVFAGNRGAVSFYERCGYVRLRGEPDFYGAGLDAWVYRKTVVRE